MTRRRSSSLTQTEELEMGEIRLETRSKHVTFTDTTSDHSLHDQRRSSSDLTDLEDATLLLKEEAYPTKHTASRWSLYTNHRRKFYLITAILSIPVLFLVFSPSRKRQPFAQSPKIGPSWPGFPNIENYFAFGDSWTTTHFWVEGPQPSPQNPLGNPAFPGYTSSNGMNYVGHLATTYNQSFVKVYDFAYAGSVIDAKIDYTMLDWLDLSHQIKDEFLSWYTPNSIHTPRAPWSPENSLFSAFFGINDVLVYNRTTHRMKDVFTTYEKLIGDLYAAKARNFLLINIPPIDRSPEVRIRHAREDWPLYTQDLAAFNALVADLAEHLRRKFKDITLFVYDIHDLFERVMESPESLSQTAGLKNLTGICESYEKLDKGMEANATDVAACGGLDWREYLWLNKVHVTPAVHEAMAFEIAEMLGSAPAWKGS